MLEGSRLGTDVAIAMDAATRLDLPLAVTMLRVRGSRRRRQRTAQRLRDAEGFVYALGGDCYTVLMPGSTPWDAFTWALRQGRHVSAGVAGVRVGDDADALLRRAATGLARACAGGAPAWLERPESVTA